MHYRFGVERISGGKDRVTLCSNREAAERKAQEYVDQLKKGEVVALVAVPCDDKKDEPISAEFRIYRVWEFDQNKNS